MMKKILMILMMVFGLSVAAFADVYLITKDAFNNYIIPIYEDTGVQPLIAYVADTWEDVYEKTSVDKYGWSSINTTYCDCKYQYCLIIKCRVKRNGDLGWICLEFPGDGSENQYVADAD